MSTPYEYMELRIVKMKDRIDELQRQNGIMREVLFLYATEPHGEPGPGLAQRALAACAEGSQNDNDAHTGDANAACEQEKDK